MVQDDSGIPVVYFKRDQWAFHPFGRYLGPIAIFPGRHQNQLAEIYHRGPTKPIDWGMGYRWRTNESNVLLAVRKDIGTRQQLRPAISETPAVKPQPAKPRPRRRWAGDAATDAGHTAQRLPAREGRGIGRRPRRPRRPFRRRKCRRSRAADGCRAAIDVLAISAASDLDAVWMPMRHDRARPARDLHDASHSPDGLCRDRDAGP